MEYVATVNSVRTYLSSDEDEDTYENIYMRSGTKVEHADDEVYYEHNCSVNITFEPDVPKPSIQLGKTYRVTFTEVGE